MKKIVTKTSIRRKLEQKAKVLMICNAKKKFDHCLTYCTHGIYHEKEVGRDACHNNTEICKIQPRIVRVTCRHLTAQEKRDWIEKEINK